MPLFTWDIDSVRRILDLYPGATAQPQMIPEARYGIDINGDRECQDVDGISVDKDGDGEADFFLYDHGFLEAAALTGGNLQRYFSGPACFDLQQSRQTTCEERPSDLEPSSFPVGRARVLPDTYGKITSVMVAADRRNAQVIRRVLAARPDLQVQMLYPNDNERPRDITISERIYLAAYGRFLPGGLAPYMIGRDIFGDTPNISFFPYAEERCDSPPCGLTLWTQDKFYIGRTSAGELFAAAINGARVDKYVEPLYHTLGAAPYDLNGSYPDGGDIISSSTHLFINAEHNPSPSSNFAQLIGSGLDFVPIDIGEIMSAAHTDMVVTLTEERRHGRPVVIVADAFPRGQNLTEEAALNKIARHLEDIGFYVERIAYVYTGDVAERDLLPTPVACSFNNVLIEEYNQWSPTQGSRIIKRVYMPKYRRQPCAGYNEDAAGVYRRLGYEVVFIEGLDGAAYGGGSLRCMVKVTNRENLDHSLPRVTDPNPTENLADIF